MLLSMLLRVSVGILLAGLFIQYVEGFKRVIKAMFMII